MIGLPGFQCGKRDQIARQITWNNAKSEPAPTWHVFMCKVTLVNISTQGFITSHSGDNKNRGKQEAFSWNFLR